MIALFCFVFELSPVSKLYIFVILIIFISFEYLIVLSIDIIIPGSQFFVGCKNDCSLGLTFYLLPLDEFTGKNEIVSLQSSFHICFTITDCSDSDTQFYLIKYIY